VDDRATIFIFVMCFLLEKDTVDVKIAFLNGELDEEVYAQTPRGIAGWPSRNKRLLKAMYGLKQAHKAWHSKISRDLTHMGFF
jgi:Reverse transcriptase (RNA-dependent DNA polymerase)